jgi:tripartite-type tricarboxylate transporter receptor subunit TctC
MNAPGFRKRHIVERGLEPVIDTPDAFARFIASEHNAIGALVKEAGIEPQ